MVTGLDGGVFRPVREPRGDNRGRRHGPKESGQDDQPMAEQSGAGRLGTGKHDYTERWYRYYHKGRLLDVQASSIGPASRPETPSFSKHRTAIFRVGGPGVGPDGLARDGRIAASGGAGPAAEGGCQGVADSFSSSFFKSSLIRTLTPTSIPPWP